LLCLFFFFFNEPKTSEFYTLSLHDDLPICSIGTGGTISGLINSAHLDQKIIGFPSLKGDFLSDDIRKFAENSNWELVTDYHFGGYGKINEELVRFINDF